MSDNVQEHDSTPLSYTEHIITKKLRYRHVHVSISITTLVIVAGIVILVTFSEEFRRFVIYPIVVSLCTSILVTVGKAISPWIKRHFF